jgi:hypothetical protein
VSSRPAPSTSSSSSRQAQVQATCKPAVACCPLQDRHRGSGQHRW